MKVTLKSQANLRDMETNAPQVLHTDELNSIVLLLDARLVEDEGVDVALLVLLCIGLCDGTFACCWSGGSLYVGEWSGSNDVSTGLVSPLACISFSIAADKSYTCNLR